jgi:hypothetical protein
MPTPKSAGTVPAAPTSTPPKASLAAALPLQEENFLAESGCNAYTFILHSFVRSTRQLSHVKDRRGVWSCIPEVNLVQLLFGKYGLASPESHPLFRNPESTTQKGTFMKCASVVKVAAAVAAVAGMVGCTDLKPIQAQIDDLKAQVAKTSSDLAGAKSSADSANSAAQSASQAASGAQSTANQALAAAHASQSCCDATNEKIDRMFKRSVSK